MDILVPSGTSIVVVGDIHEHFDQFNEMVGLIKPSEKMFFVSVGDIYDKGEGIRAAESIVDQLERMSHLGYGYVVKGNHELKHIKNARQNTEKMTSQLAWLHTRPLSLSFVFANRTRLTVLHGGVTPQYRWEDLDTVVDVAYIRELDENGKKISLVWTRQQDGRKELKQPKSGTVWHKLYDGRFGYIAAGHDPQKTGIPAYYRYSCNLDTAVYETGILTGQIFNESGLASSPIQIHGKSSRWVPKAV